MLLSNSFRRCDFLLCSGEQPSCHWSPNRQCQWYLSGHQQHDNVQQPHHQLALLLLPFSCRGWADTQHDSGCVEAGGRDVPVSAGHQSHTNTQPCADTGKDLLRGGGAGSSRLCGSVSGRCDWCGPAQHKPHSCHQLLLLLLLSDEAHPQCCCN